MCWGIENLFWAQIRNRSVLLAYYDTPYSLLITIRTLIPLLLFSYSSDIDLDCTTYTPLLPIPYLPFGSPVPFSLPPLSIILPFLFFSFPIMYLSYPAYTPFPLFILFYTLSFPPLKVSLPLSVSPVRSRFQSLIYLKYSTYFFLSPFSSLRLSLFFPSYFPFFSISFSFFPSFLSIIYPTYTTYTPSSPFPFLSSVPLLPYYSLLIPFPRLQKLAIQRSRTP